MGAKRLVGLVVSVALVVGLVLFLKTTRTNEQALLRICTWSNYYPEKSLKDFTAQTGIKVELSYVSSNEELLAKMKAGATGYDLIQPSDYMVRQMTKLGMLQELDHGLLGNLNHLDDYYKTLPYDAGLKYSVPFTWGTTGIAVNTEKVKVGNDGVSWKLLTSTPDPRHTSVLDDMREVFGAVFLSRNLSLNEKDIARLNDAKSQILDLKTKILMFTSEPKQLLLRDEISLAHIYSTDGIQAHAENPKISYFIPKEGATVWTDNFALPKSSPNRVAAHQFINFFLEPNNALFIINENHLATPNKTARAQLPKEVLGDPNQYPTPELMKRLEFMDDPGDTLEVINRMWTELKS